MDELADSPRRQREGVYDARVIGPPGRRAKIILLDTRYFRCLLVTGENNVMPSDGRYIPNPDPKVTMLRESQWRRLEDQLQVPAEVQLIVSSTQLLSEFSGGGHG